MRFPVLLYHNLNENPATEYDVPPQNYRLHLSWLVEHGYTVDDCDGLLQRLQTMEFPDRYVVVTFDDGHRSNVEAATITEELCCRATFFIAVEACKTRADFLNAREIVELAAEASIGSHSISHMPLTKMAHDQMEHELYASKRWLEDTIGRPVDNFSAPYGDINRRVEVSAANCGYALIANSKEWWNTPEHVAATGVINRVMVYSSYDMRQFENIITLNGLFYSWRLLRYSMVRIIKSMLSLDQIHAIAKFKRRILS